MRTPVDKISIVRGFKNTGLNKHYGIDFGWYSKGNENQPIYAAEDGVVIYNRHQASGGYVIHILHDFGEGGFYVTEYGHLLKNSQRVKEGTRVKKGQMIAKMGKSGICSGYHLHFGVYRGSKINYNKKANFLDPIRFLNRYTNQEATKDAEEKIYHTRVVQNVKDEPLLVHNQPNTNKSSVCGELHNGDIVEYYGTYNGMAVIDTIVGRWTTNKYLK